MTHNRRVRLYDDYRSDWKEDADMSYLKMSDLQYPDLRGHQGIAQWKANLPERLARLILCAGFIAVLVVEISLLIQALRIFG
jgi:hypothetical protein